MTVTIRYWRGMTQLEGKATTYRGALRVAGRNQNASGPRFYDERGVQLYDDGNGLRYEDSEEYVV